MTTTPIHLYSGVRSADKRAVLAKGGIFAAAGILLWLVCGVTMPPETLSQWGIWVFIVGGALICLGMVPYRRLTHLEAHPYHLVVDKSLTLSRKGKKLFSVPMQNIERLAYREDRCHGIALWLTPGTLNAAYIAKNQKRYGSDLFLPCFGRHAYTTLQEEREGEG